MYLFFDTETTGFLPQGRMTQLAFILTDENGNIIKQFESLIKPDNWIIKDTEWYLENGYDLEESKKKGGFFTKNNMSTKRCKENGIDVFIALREFQEALKLCKYKIAHNKRFDDGILLKEIKLAKITHQLFQYKKGFCTMLSTTSFCNLKKSNGSIKWPTLMELHNKLFNCDFEGAHDALDDVIAMKNCFFKLKELKIINI